MVGRRYVVLGSNSFAGAAFVARALRDGHQLLGINRSAEGSPIFLPYRWDGNASRYSFMQADINNHLPEIIERIGEFQPHVVVDFAGQGMVAESWQQPEQWYTTNIVAKVKLHDFLRRCSWLESYIRISTPEVYGSTDGLLKETWACAPSTPYAVSHTATDLSLRAFQQHYGFPAIVTRFANFYGPGQQLYRIVPRTIICALTGRKLKLHGGGVSVRAFIHSDDVADAIVRTIDHGRTGEIYHFSPERFFTIREVVEIICQRIGIAFESVAEVAPDRPAKDQAYLMDSTRARAELGWRDSVAFERGVDATIAWVRDNLAEIERLPQDYLHKA
ncbi:NAD-dependent epimerase/dehydratase family protein (plasmid) [Azospirillum sp. 412522]|nr:GDP-mannose 4,6-dehydratase [Azospirillum sp. 412522]MBY6266473.1 NAD-dependent epimerase/dehydratase family protein [Azospirillum sp. 412522]